MHRRDSSAAAYSLRYSFTYFASSRSFFNVSCSVFPLLDRLARRRNCVIVWWILGCRCALFVLFSLWASIKCISPLFAKPSASLRIIRRSLLCSGSFLRSGWWQIYYFMSVRHQLLIGDPKVLASSHTIIYNALFILPQKIFTDAYILPFDIRVMKYRIVSKYIWHPNTLNLYFVGRFKGRRGRRRIRRRVPKRRVHFRYRSMDR